MRGLDVFKEHFKGYQGCYVFIGGTACTVLFEDVGESFRATKDLDIVLILENINAEFVQLFWQFIRNGQYKDVYRGEIHGTFYRFVKPADARYPQMIELFSRKPANLEIFPGSHLMPLHIADEVSSLSAILLNDDYYRFLLDGRKVIDGVSVLDELHLIPFKAKAWCELTDRQGQGEEGLTRHIKKHCKDISTLLTLIGVDVYSPLTGDVLLDMERFINAMRSESLDVHSTGIKGMTAAYFCERLESLYIG